MSIDVTTPLSDTLALTVPASGTVTVSLISGTPIAVSIDSPTAANGIPAGGTTGQHLIKLSATNFDAEWDDVDLQYRHVQGVSASQWVITHNLGYRPGGIYVQDSGAFEHQPEVTHDSDNQITLDFVASFTGEAYLS